jgi:hypothetical protein
VDVLAQKDGAHAAGAELLQQLELTGQELIGLEARQVAVADDEVGRSSEGSDGNFHRVRGSELAVPDGPAPAAAPQCRAKKGKRRWNDCRGGR